MGRLFCVSAFCSRLLSFPVRFVDCNLKGISMRNLFTTSLQVFTLGAVLAFAPMPTANAKIPAEVMEPYRAYIAAQKEGDEKATYNNAKKAWQAAEKALGDHKTTGDLANNFAALSPIGTNPYKNYKTRLKARKRSIELAKFHSEDDSPIVDTERRLRLAEMSLALTIYRGGKEKDGGKGIYFDDVEEAIETHDLQGTTFEGDLEVLKSRFYKLRKRYAKSVEHAERAEVIYKNRTDDWDSVYPYVFRLYKGDSLNAMDKPIDAALEYQTVMQNLEGAISSDHPIVESAFVKWMNVRSELDDAGRLDEAEAAGLCECWPFEDYKSKVTPLVRKPAKMPSGFKQGRYSGYVNVMFDVTDQGTAENIRIVNSTKKTLEKPTIEAVKTWEFTAKSPEEAEGARKDVSNRMVFRLLNNNGDLLPFPDGQTP